MLRHPYAQLRSHSVPAPVLIKDKKNDKVKSLVTTTRDEIQFTLFHDSSLIKSVNYMN